MHKSGEVFMCWSTEKSASQYFLKENEFVLWWSNLMGKGESFLETEEWTKWPPKIPMDPRTLGHCLFMTWPDSSLSLSLWACTNDNARQQPYHPAHLYVRRKPGGVFFFFWENLAETFFFFWNRRKIKSQGCGKITFCALRYQNRPFVRTELLLKCEKFLEGISSILSLLFYQFISMSPLACCLSAV